MNVSEGSEVLIVSNGNASSQPPKRVTVPQIAAMKEEGRAIVMITAYDYPTALLSDQAGVDMILVGDSLAMAALGHDTTLPVTIDEMLHHTRAVRRGVKRAMVVGDLPFGAYHGGVDQAVASAARFLQEAGADAVKLEGGRRVAQAVGRMTEMGIPVVGHIGLTPQSVNMYGGFKVQGRQESQRQAIIEDAKALEEAGAFCIVLEAIPSDLGREVTEAVAVPTIGIGAGPHCDGQVLVISDVLGLTQDFKPKFVKRYAELGDAARKAIETYAKEVRRGTFPTDEFSYQ